MGLGQVRAKINQIDDNMKQLFDERMECSNQVAAVKISESDKVFKPLREKEIVERFSHDEEYVAFVKKVMQISRKRQYGIFFKQVDSVSEALGVTRNQIEKEGMLRLKLKADDTQENGLNAHNILSIIADTSLSIRRLNLDESGCFDIELVVDGTQKSIEEALVLKLMMQEETI